MPVLCYPGKTKDPPVDPKHKAIRPNGANDSTAFRDLDQVVLAVVLDLRIG
jgi:hypothetical protein